MPYKDKEKQKTFQAAHYQANKTLCAERKRTTRKKYRDYGNGIKTNKPCADCGQSYHFSQMQFDHVKGDKIDGISVLVRCRNLQAIKDEIEKCELVCANCHALRTWNRLHITKPK